MWRRRHGILCGHYQLGEIVGFRKRDIMKCQNGLEGFLRSLLPMVNPGIEMPLRPEYQGMSDPNITGCFGQPGNDKGLLFSRPHTAKFPPLKLLKQETRALSIDRPIPPESGR